MAATPYRSSVPGQAGFGRLLHAEWTKLRSVPRWVLTLVAAAVLIVLVGLLAAGGTANESVGGEGGGPSLQPIRDEGHFVFRELQGDGELVARVATQADSHQQAKAGLMLRADDRPGARYAAIVLTPERGVRLLSNFRRAAAGSDATAPRWLRLTRAGDTVTGSESPDGRTWTRVGSVRLGRLPTAVEVGLLVASPNVVRIERQFGGETLDEEPSLGHATFDGVRLTGDRVPAGSWQQRDRSTVPGSSSQTGDTLTISGSGDLGPYEFGDDVTQTILSGAAVGMLAIVALAVLFVTSEYRRGLIRTTFAAAPARGRVLVAKAAVVAAAAFAAGLVGSVLSFLLARPIVESSGDAPSLADGPVLRAVVGTALVLAAIGVLAVAVATLARRSSLAICGVVLVVLLPQIVGTGLPLEAAKWVERLTPSAGFAMQQTVHRYDTAIDPWAGLGVLCAYTAALLALATWRLQRRDA